MSLLTNLQSAYTFETNGSEGLDFSGNGHDLTKTGTVNQAAGHALPGSFGVSWSDGGGFSPQGRLTINGNYIPGGGTSDYSGVAWVYVLNGTWNTTPYPMFILGAENAGTDQYGLHLRQTTQEFYFNVSGGGGAGNEADDGQGAISFSTWYFLYFEWDQTAQKVGISRNNTSLVQVSGPSTPFAGPVEWAIGSNGHGAGFTMDGRTDGIALWTRKLTTDERTFLYNTGAGLEYPFPGGRRHGSSIYFL